MVDGLRFGNTHIEQAYPNTLNRRTAGTISKCQNIRAQRQYKKMIQQGEKTEAFYMVAKIGGVF